MTFNWLDCSLFLNYYLKMILPSYVVSTHVLRTSVPPPPCQFSFFSRSSLFSWTCSIRVGFNRTHSAVNWCGFYIHDLITFQLRKEAVKFSIDLNGLQLNYFQKYPLQMLTILFFWNLKQGKITLKLFFSLSFFLLYQYIYNKMKYNIYIKII